MSGKKKILSREEMSELYRDLTQAMNKVKETKGQTMASPSTNETAKQIAAQISQAMKKDIEKEQGESSTLRAAMSKEMPPMHEDIISITRADASVERHFKGTTAAIVFTIGVCAVKLVFSVLEHTGTLTIPQAQAAMQRQENIAIALPAKSQYSPEQLALFSGLDARRADLSKRAEKLDDREKELVRRERDMVGKIQELKELTAMISLEREKDGKKRQSQLEQLANVYGAMAPQEAAGLLDQLDTSIALSLVSRMPEKRIGQILALMSREKALTLTQLLSRASTTGGGAEGGSSLGENSRTSR